MSRLINLILRAFARYQVRCLQIQYNDQTTALQHVAYGDDFLAILEARQITRNELDVADLYYRSLIKPVTYPMGWVA